MSVLAKVKEKVVPPRCVNYREILRTFDDHKKGLEIGGPSGIFKRRGLLPIYTLAARIDNCAFSESTMWGTHRTDRGDTFICEATDIQAPDRAYDFVLASHVLEHCANPLKALHEWRRVLRPGGILLVVLPDPKYTFDHRRPITAFDHLLEDYACNRDETDLQHLEEILRLHDLERDPLAGSFEQFEARSLANAQNRCLHQHVFDGALAKQLLEHAGFFVWYQDSVRPFHMVTLAHR